MVERFEIWSDCWGQPGYEVSNFGRVRSRSREVRDANGNLRSYRSKMLSPGINPSGHLTVCCGKGNTRYVHELVLEAFIGPRPKGKECRHLNDVPWDNRLDNLRWGTRSENLKDAYRNGKR